MPKAPHSFKRLVLGLQPTAPDRSVQLAAALAEMLDLELLGLFLEDESLRDLAAFPFARELRMLGGGWHPLNLEGLSRELELAARSAERAFTQAVKHLSMHCQFEVRRGAVATTIATVSQTSDIVLIVEPASVAERTTAQFSRLLQAAFGSGAAVMIAPTRIARVRGPIVAIAAAADDPGIAVAATISQAVNETLIVLDIGQPAIDDERLRSLASETGLRVRHVVAKEAAHADPATWARMLRPLHERLIVMTRGVADERTVPILTAERQVPVLLLEPTALAPSAADASGSTR